MIGIDDFLIGVIASGIVAWFQDKDSKREQSQQAEIDALVARCNQIRKPQQLLDDVGMSTLRDLGKDNHELLAVTNSIISDPLLAEDWTKWLLEPDPQKYDQKKSEIIETLTKQCECGSGEIEKLIERLENRLNQDLGLVNLRTHKEHRLILTELRDHGNWQKQISRSNAHIVSLLNKLLDNMPLPPLSPVQPQAIPINTKTNKLLSGGMPRDEDMNQEIDFQRRIYPRVMEAITKCDKPALFTFLAEVQMGKTTFLKRVGWDLAKQGYPVFQLESSKTSCRYADWLIKNKSPNDLPYILLIDDPRKDAQNFENQINSFYDHDVPVVVLAAERRRDWQKAELYEARLYDVKYEYALGNADGEAIELVEYLKKRGVLDFDEKHSETIFQDIRQLPGGPSYFQEVISIASNDKYRPLPVVVQEKLHDSKGDKNAEAFVKLYSLMCLPGSVGLSFPAEMANEILSFEIITKAMLFNDSMSVQPIELAQNLFKASHEQHALQFLDWSKVEYDVHIADVLSSIVKSVINNKKHMEFLGNLLEALRVRGVGEFALAVWDKYADQFTDDHWKACQADILSFHWGIFFYEQKRFPIALEVNRIAIEGDLDDSIIHSNYGILLFEEAETEEARKHFKKALEIDPRNVDAHNNYAFLLKQEGEKKEAWQHFKKALEIDPRHVNTHYNYAILLKQEGETKEARKHYEKALEIDPRHVSAHYNFAILLVGEDKTGKASEHYEKAIEIDPRHVEAHYNYALLLNKAGETKEAREHFEKVMEIDPTHAMAAANLCMFLIDKCDFVKAIDNAYLALRDGSLPDKGIKLLKLLASHVDKIKSLLVDENANQLHRGTALAILMMVARDDVRPLGEKYWDDPSFSEAKKVAEQILQHYIKDEGDEKKEEEEKPE